MIQNTCCSCFTNFFWHLDRDTWMLNCFKPHMYPHTWMCHTPWIYASDSVAMISLVFHCSLLHGFYWVTSTICLKSKMFLCTLFCYCCFTRLLYTCSDHLHPLSLVLVFNSFMQLIWLLSLYFSNLQPN